MSVCLVGLVVAIVFYVVCFIATNSFIISAIPASLALVYFLFFAQPQLSIYKKKLLYFKLTNQFVNNFIISLSIQPVMDVAYENAMKSLNFDFGNKLKGTEDLSSFEKIKYLGNYFSFHTYQVFVQVVDLWQEQGGDILKMTHFLTNQFREIDDYIITCKRMSEKKTVEFIVLWTFALSILGIIRFALSQFYTMIEGNKMFLIGVVCIFVLVLISTQILISKVAHLDLKGWKKYDK